MTPSSNHQVAAVSGKAFPPPLSSVPETGAACDRGFHAAILTAARWRAIVGALAASAGVLMLVSLQLGAQYVEFGEILRILGRAFVGAGSVGAGLDTTGIIVMQVRLPRVFLGFLVGCSLASVGVALQALLRNPLADPYVLGVSSGAALGISLAVLLGIGTTMFAVSALPVCGFFGGLLALLVVYRMAATYDRLPIHSVLLAGVILNAIFSALIMFITSIMEPNRSFGMVAWLMGTLTAPDYPALTALSVYLLICLFLLFRQVTLLNILTLGDETARALGIETERAKRSIFLISALVTGAVVSVSGMVGFIGMVIPHAVRLVVGADHRLLMPASALVGGMFLMAADTFARTFFAPSELPVGIITALAGGPFFIYLLIWRKDRLA